jgi:hypothetical protein
MFDIICTVSSYPYLHGSLARRWSLVAGRWPRDRTRCNTIVECRLDPSLHLRPRRLEARIVAPRYQAHPASSRARPMSSVQVMMMSEAEDGDIDIAQLSDSLGQAFDRVIDINKLKKPSKRQCLRELVLLTTGRWQPR